METLQEVKTRVYKFGNKTADGNSKMKSLLGGKGANLAEMSAIGIPVPPGFTITTEVCEEYNLLGQDAVIDMIKDEVEAAIEKIENIMGTTYGNA
ncbi:MAG: pyruvate, phosphate dikinase, partial [Flavobacteriaceae bacterium]|nr:pyruvate, phosphate dikinase [Flavobacteriaceae bacterium]